VTVQLGEDDSFAYTAEQAADQVLAALGGNPAKDYTQVTVAMPPSTGAAGVPPPPVGTGGPP
jgi:hypothetical protein